MDQISFANAEYESKRCKNRLEVFLELVEKLMPWKRLEKKVARHYHNGRPPYSLSAMLRIPFMRLFYNLNDPAMEDAGSVYLFFANKAENK